MKIYLLLLHLMSIVVTTSFCQDETAIKELFKQYQSVVVEGNPRNIGVKLNSNSERYLTDLVSNVVSADSSKIASAKNIDKLIILLFRNFGSKRQFQSFNADSTFRFAVKFGIFGRTSVDNKILSEIEIQGTTARATMANRDQTQTAAIEFTKEAGEWKVDLVSQFTAANEKLNQMVAMSTEKENEYIEQLVRRLSKKALKERIWNELN